MECVICLEDICGNDYSKFNCCNNSAHNVCLKSWVVTNINNKNVANCFICSQKNEAIESIIMRNTNANANANTNTNTNANELLNSNNNNFIIIDISTNNIRQIQPYIESKYFFILKFIYSTLVILILLLGFFYISL